MGRDWENLENGEGDLGKHFWQVGSSMGAKRQGGDDGCGNLQKR